MTRGSAYVVLFAVLALLPQHAPAQSFPARPIRFIVSAAPGATIDLLARMVAHKASEGLGQSMVVENMPGGSGFLAAGLVARAPADGYTLLVGQTATQSAHLFEKNLNYNPATDFAPITGGGLSVTCLVVNANLGVNSVAELVEL